MASRGQAKGKNSYFPIRLGQRRHENGLTPAQMCEKVGCALQAYQSWERGTREPSLQTVSILADTLHTTTDYLLGIDNNENSKMRVMAYDIGVSQSAAAKLNQLAEEFEHRTLPLNGLIMHPDFEKFILDMWILYNKAALLQNGVRTGTVSLAEKANAIPKDSLSRVVSGIDLLDYELSEITEEIKQIISKICMVDSAKETWIKAKTDELYEVYRRAGGGAADVKNSDNA